MTRAARRSRNKNEPVASPEANAHLIVVAEVMTALSASVKARIEKGGTIGVKAQKEILPQLYTPVHRQTALYVIYTELHAVAIPELEEGLSSWVLQIKRESGMLSADTMALLDSQPADHTETDASLVIR